tara:strand:- start:544 stop:672 length:129 start_codon:yes stop_codon:yes gene_type:complete
MGKAVLAVHRLCLLMLQPLPAGFRRRTVDEHHTLFYHTSLGR